MKHINTESISSASLIFAPVVALLYLLILSPIGYISAPYAAPVESTLSEEILYLQHLMPTLATILSFVLVAGGAVINVMMATRYNLFGVALQLPLLLYVSFIVGFSTSENILSAPLGAFVGLMAVRDFFRTYENSGRTSILFTASFWVGVLPLLYPSAVVLWLAPFVLMSLFDKSSRELAVVVAGLLLPISIYIYVRWLFGAEFVPQIVDFFKLIVAPYHHPTPIWNSYATHAIALALLCAVLAAVGYMQFDRMSIRFVARTRLYAALAIVCFAFAMCLIPSFGVESLAIVASPLSFVVTPTILRGRWWVSALVFIAILLLVGGVYPL